MTLDTFLAVMATLALGAFSLLSVAWIPWTVAWAMFRSDVVPAATRNVLAQAVAVASTVLTGIAILEPQYLHLVPPVAVFIDSLLSDAFLAGLDAQGVQVVSAILLAECAVALLVPTLLIASLVAAIVFEAALSPPLHILDAVRRFLDRRVRGTLASVERRIAEGRRREAAARIDERERADRAQDEWQQDQERRRSRHESLGRLVDALEGLASVPDCRRAAQVAKSAEHLAGDDRRQLFGVYREQMVAHVARGLEAEADKGQLLASLRELLEQLDVPGAEHETAYIAADAEKQRPPKTIQLERAYRAQVEEIRDLHRIRVAVIKDMHLDDPDLEERLIEAEETRLTTALLKLAGPVSPTLGDTRDVQPLAELDAPASVTEDDAGSAHEPPEDHPCDDNDSSSAAS